MRAAMGPGAIFALGIGFVIILIGLMLVFGGDQLWEIGYSLERILGALRDFLIPVGGIFVGGLLIYIGAEKGNPLALMTGLIIVAGGLGFLSSVTQFLNVLPTLAKPLIALALIGLAYATSGFQRVVFAAMAAVLLGATAVLDLSGWFTEFMYALTIPFSVIASLPWYGVIIAAVALLIVGGLLLRILRKGV